jgi:5-methylcytosine-specific restriction protein B
MAFRRRFAFVDLEPSLGTAWREWLAKMQLEAGVADTIQQRLEQLNSTITADSRLGKAFRIGHSYVTPSHSLDGRSSRDWFAEVVATELRPLLHEYWFDAPDVAEREANRLLEGWLGQAPPAEWPHDPGPRRPDRAAPLRHGGRHPRADPGCRGAPVRLTGPR